jgi:two-component system sensor histidine kinase VicK
MDYSDYILSSEQLVDVLLSSKVATAIHITEDAVIQKVNAAMLTVWGKDESVIGKTLEDALPELKGQPFIDMFKRVWNEGLILSGTDTPADLEIDGQMQTIYFDFEYRAIKNAEGKTIAILHTATDITERYLIKQREIDLAEELSATNEELVASNEELRTSNEELNESAEILELLNHNLGESERQTQFAIEAANLGTWDLNPLTMEFAGNERLRHWFGLQPKEKIELTKATDIIVENDRPRVLAAIEKAMQYGADDYNIEYIIAAEGFKLRVVKAKGKALFDADKQPIRFSGTLQDITEQRQDEERKNDFIGMVSHELKTPLTSVKAFVQILNMKAKRNNDEFAANILIKADSQISKMAKMINGFLNVNQLESGKIYLNKDNFDLDVLIREIMDETAVLYSGHKLSMGHCGSININADRDKIGLVVSNLLSNAAKYSAVGGNIDVQCDVTDGVVQISVADQGMGISQTDADRLFERFYRADNNKNISGFGIGLYLCSEIISFHKGKIWVDSEVGKGSTFYFSLPLQG